MAKERELRRCELPEGDGTGAAERRGPDLNRRGFLKFASGALAAIGVTVTGRQVAKAQEVAEEVKTALPDPAFAEDRIAENEVSAEFAHPSQGEALQAEPWPEEVDHEVAEEVAFDEERTTEVWTGEIDNKEAIPPWLPDTFRCRVTGIDRTASRVLVTGVGEDQYAALIPNVEFELDSDEGIYLGASLLVAMGESSVNVFVRNR